MAMFETWLKSDFQEDLTVEHLRGNFFSGDSLGNLVGVEVFDNGEPASLSGNVVGYVIRADGSTVVVPGTLSGNKASIILPACAYNVYGIMSIVIKVGSVTVGACTVHVYRSTTDTLVDPEHVIPSVDLLIQMVEECEAAVAVKADKVTNATNDHLAALDAYGNLKDSGKYATDFLASTLKGSANGVAELGSDGKVPSSQLPSYVDDVLEYDSISAFPATGETGKIYVAKDTNKTYRWSGSAYVEISPSLALGETSSTAYRGDRGKTAYDHATDSGRITTATASGFYKIAVTSEGHVGGFSAVTKGDLTSLGVYEKPANGIPATDLEESYVEEPSVAGTSGQVLTSDGQGGQSWQTPSSGVTDYDLLTNRPQIAGTTLTGDKSLADLGIASAADLDDKLDEPATAGTSGQVLTSDGQGGASWQTPSSGTVMDVQEDGTSIVSSGVANILTMTGAGASAAGTKGLVPAPSAGDDGKFLKGDGTWGNPSVSPSTIVDLVYPVGSIYMSVSSAYPATLFGGTWERLKSRFLLGAEDAGDTQGDPYIAGATGGAASVSYTPAGTVGSHTLTTDEIPSHSHGLNSHTHTYTYPTGSTAGDNSDSGSTTISFSNGHACLRIDTDGIYQATSSCTWTTSANRKFSGASMSGGNISSAVSLVGSQSHSHKLNNHTHTVNTGSTNTGAASGSTESAGTGGGHSHGFTGTAATIATMPPYLTVYMWKRTA